MTVVIIINKQWSEQNNHDSLSEPLDNHDSSDYYKQSTVWTTRQPDSSDYYKQSTVWTTRQPWQ